MLTNTFQHELFLDKVHLLIKAPHPRTSIPGRGTKTCLTLGYIYLIKVVKTASFNYLKGH